MSPAVIDAVRERPGLSVEEAESIIADWREISRQQALIERRLASFETADLPLSPPVAAELRGLLEEAEELAARISTFTVSTFTSRYRDLIDTGRITVPMTGLDGLEGLISSAIGS